MNNKFTSEQVETSINFFNSDPTINIDRILLTILTGRFSRLEADLYKGTIASDHYQVELNKLFYALVALAEKAGINNLTELICE